jgi:diguanylate cyclase
VSGAVRDRELRYAPVTDSGEPTRSLERLLSGIAWPIFLKEPVGELRGRLANNEIGPDMATRELARLMQSAISEGVPTRSGGSPSPDPRNAAAVPDNSGARVRTQDGSAEQVLLNLLASLSLSPDLETQADQLRDLLYAGVPSGGWDTPLQRVADLVAAMRRGLEAEKSDLENFLKQLTERLNDLDRYLQGVAADQAAASAGSARVEQAMAAEMRGIHSNVREATSLDQLKAAVHERLEALHTHLDENRRIEQQRRAQLDERLNHMTSRLKAVEQESTHLRAHLRQRRVEAMRDPLTGIANRLAFEERLAREYARCKRHGHPLSLLVLDVDHFKSINDGYGHKAGDRALKLIARQLRGNLRESDFLGRYGGEEFVALLPDTPHEGVAGVAEKLRLAIENSDFHHHGKKVPVTISIGYAHFLTGERSEDVFQRADEALYRAKAEGRNRCCGSPEPGR